MPAPTRFLPSLHLVLVGSGLLVDAGLLSSGCMIDRGAIDGVIDAAVGGGLDAALDTTLDAGLDTTVDTGPLLIEVDAWTAPTDPDAAIVIDAAVTPIDDAYVPRPVDAFTPEPDAFSCSSRVEVCNGIDDNCNGTVDEGVCTLSFEDGSTVTCVAQTRGASAYLVCRARASWVTARAACRSFSTSYDLLVFEDVAEQAAVSLWLSMDNATWLGLTNNSEYLGSGGTSDLGYRWVDGTTPSFTPWSGGEPSVGGGGFGCARLEGDGTWDAVGCTGGGGGGAGSRLNNIACELRRP